jgi:phospholipase/carboxylesterase
MKTYWWQGILARMSEPLLDAVEIDPPGPPQASVIWLHGLGADGHDFEPLIPELHIVREHAVRVVLPHAPRRAVTVNGGMVMPAWYDISSPDLAAREDAAGIERSRARLEALIAREVDGGVPSERIFLAGFSQGGAIVLHTGLRHAQRLGGLLALSTYLPLRGSLGSEASPANAGAPVFMAHGTADPVVPYGLGTASRDLLLAAGYRVDWHSYPMFHAVCMEEIGAIRAWLLSRLSASPGGL